MSIRDSERRRGSPWPWLTRGRAVFVGLLWPALLLFLVWRIWGIDEGSARSVGGVLELSGLATVAVGFARLRSEFGGELGFLQLWRRAAKGTLRKLKNKLGRKPAEGTLRGVAVSDSFVARDGVLRTVTLGPEASFEKRVELLEAEVERLRNEISSVALALETERRERQQELEAARRTQGEADQAIRATITSLATGHLRLESIGLSWLMLGLVVASWPGLITAVWGV